MFVDRVVVCRLEKSGSLLVNSCWRLLVFSRAMLIQDSSDEFSCGCFTAVGIGMFSTEHTCVTSLGGMETDVLSLVVMDTSVLCLVVKDNGVLTLVVKDTGVLSLGSEGTSLVPLIREDEGGAGVPKSERKDRKSVV